MLLEEQHPNVYACVPLNDSHHCNLEVYISKEQDSNGVVNNDLIFQMPFGSFFSLVLPLGTRLKLSLLNNLPLLPKSKALTGSQKYLAIFGVIMDVRINTESATGFI